MIQVLYPSQPNTPWITTHLLVIDQGNPRFNQDTKNRMSYTKYTFGTDGFSVYFVPDPLSSGFVFVYLCKQRPSTSETRYTDTPYYKWWTGE